MPKRKQTTTYFVQTWDTDAQQFTPQAGVSLGPYSLWGLRRALRKLQLLGYPARRGDCSVYVEADVQSQKATL